MKGLLAYSGLTTKVKAMQSNLVTKAQYEEIAQLGSVKELFFYLQQHPGYEHLFANLDAEDIHRGDIEALLRNSTFQDFSKVYNFANVKQRKYLDQYFMRYEIEVLKRYLRNIFDSREDASLKVIRNDFEQHSRFDTKSLAEATTIDEFINLLKGTIYYKPLSSLQKSVEEVTLFDYEMRLDLFLFSTWWKQKDKFFKGEDLEIMTKSYGIRIDMLNIMWTYRSKKYYKLSPIRILPLLIPISYKLKNKEMRELIDAENIESFFDLLNRTYYKKYINSNVLEKNTFEQLESAILNKLYVNDYQKNPYSVATISTYFFLKEKEIQNLTTIIECIRYGYEPGGILREVNFSEQIV